MEISALAKKCPHCQSKQKQPISNLTKLLLIAVAISIGGAVIVNNSPTSQNSPQAVPEVSKTWVGVYAQDLIKPVLKAPATAKFCEPKVTDLTGVKYVVASCVDSENSFGAMLRSNWTVTMTYIGSDPTDPKSWKTNMVVFDDKVIYDAKE